MQAGGAHTNFQFILRLAREQIWRQSQSLQVRPAVLSFAEVLMGGIVKCFKGRAASFLVGELKHPTADQVNLLKLAPCHSDLVERPFSLFDRYRNSRSKNASTATCSRYAMNVQNDSVGFRRSMPTEVRDGLLRRAVKYRRYHVQLQRKRAATVKEKKAEYLQSLVKIGENRLARKAALTAEIMAIRLLTTAQVKTALQALSTKKAKMNMLKNQLNAWKCRLPILTKSILKRGYVQENGNVEKMTTLLERTIRLVSTIYQKSIGNAAAGATSVAPVTNGEC
jgi:hypothetical protein